MSHPAKIPHSAIAKLHGLAFWPKMVVETLHSQLSDLDQYKEASHFRHYYVTQYPSELVASLYEPAVLWTAMIEILEGPRKVVLADPTLTKVCGRILNVEASAAAIDTLSYDLLNVGF